MTPDTPISTSLAAIEAHHDGLLAYAKRLKLAAVPFIEAYTRQMTEIGDSDLDDEQSKHLVVTLGDIRKLQRAVQWPARARAESEPECDGVSG